jgi:hypothetical protein
MKWLLSISSHTTTEGHSAVPMVKSASFQRAINIPIELSFQTNFIWKPKTWHSLEQCTTRAVQRW